MGWGIGLSSNVLFTGCVNSTVNELYKTVNSIFGQFDLSLKHARTHQFKPPEPALFAG
jgi:hypothetical protein